MKAKKHRQRKLGEGEQGRQTFGKGHSQSFSPPRKRLIGRRAESEKEEKKGTSQSRTTEFTEQQEGGHGPGKMGKTASFLAVELQVIL